MSARWMIVMGVLVGLVVAGTGGCVPKARYNKAVAAARRANEGLLKCQSALNTVRADNQAVRDELGRRDAMLAARDALLVKLKSGNVGLDKAFKELLQKYNDLIARRKPGQLGVLPETVDVALRALARDHAELMEYLPKYGMLKLKSDLTFDVGSAVVKRGAEAALTKLAEIVRTPDAAAFHLYAAGHTDDIPLRKPGTIEKHGSNWGLSVHRAAAVVKVLATAGVGQRRLGAMGFSKYHPVAPNRADHKGNPLNRRVEIWIVPANRLLTASVTVQPEK